LGFARTTAISRRLNTKTWLAEFVARARGAQLSSEGITSSHSSPSFISDSASIQPGMTLLAGRLRVSPGLV
jgi:hypothetical protein